MAEVELLDRGRAPLLAQPFYAAGDPGPIAAALAHVPEVMETALPFIDSIFGRTAVDPRLKEIVVLRVSAANRCRYCVQTHTRVAAGMGFGGDELRALLGEGRPPPGWSPLERVVLAFAQALSERPETAVGLLRPHLEEPAIVELVTLGAATEMLNRFATALALPA